MTPPGYPVYEGIHVCAGGLSCDMKMVLSEIPPDSENPVAWEEQVPEVTAKAYRTSAAINQNSN